MMLMTGMLLWGCSGGADNRTAESTEKGKNPTGEKDTLPDDLRAELKEMPRDSYPDNPNWGYTAMEYGDLDYEAIRFRENSDQTYELELVAGNEMAVPIKFPKVDLSVYMPQAPEWIRKDPYLTYVGLVNQEWNRQQVHFPKEHFEIKGHEGLGEHISRIDIARNCLNAGLWEVIMYKKEKGMEKPVYHGWFDFPVPLYSHLFEKVNGIPYEKYRKPLEKWVEPENKPIDLGILREVEKEWEVPFKNLNDRFYPLVGARKKKYKNIIYPEEPQKINEMLTDSARFATFDQPGYYNTGNPRKTQLGKLAKPLSVKVRKTSPVPVEGNRTEIDITFLDRNGKDTTHLIIGGLDLSAIPSYMVNNHDEGFKMPMGISNHSFYESYEEARNNPVSRNPYYGLLFNGEGKWLDSHKVGIDGPLMHWDKEEPGKLHFYILSFERHAYVGHFLIDMPGPADRPS